MLALFVALSVLLLILCILLAYRLVHYIDLTSKWKQKAQHYWDDAMEWQGKYQDAASASEPAGTALPTPEETAEVLFEVVEPAPSFRHQLNDHGVYMEWRQAGYDIRPGFVVTIRSDDPSHAEAQFADELQEKLTDQAHHA